MHEKYLKNVYSQKRNAASLLHLIQDAKIIPMLFKFDHFHDVKCSNLLAESSSTLLEYYLVLKTFSLGIYLLCFSPHLAKIEHACEKGRFFMVYGLTAIFTERISVRVNNPEKIQASVRKSSAHNCASWPLSYSPAN